VFSFICTGLPLYCCQQVRIKKIFVCISMFLLFVSGPKAVMAAESLLIEDENADEIHVEVFNADSDLLVIWLQDHENHRPYYEKLLRLIQSSGIEIWRVNLLQSYFLPQTTAAILNMDGMPVNTLIEYALRHTRKNILLVSYDRMVLPLLKGLHRWQTKGSANPRLTGAILFYPNLFEPAVTAGIAPELHPISRVTNYPLVVVQPEMGPLSGRLAGLMGTLWDSGAPAIAHRLAQTRDWYFMSDSDHGPRAPYYRDAIPQQLQNYAAILQSLPYPTAPAGEISEKTHQPVLHDGLTEVKHNAPVQQLSGYEYFSERDVSFSLSGKVTLVNFWASWCGPCVEEIPSLNRLQAEFKHRDFQIISIDYREQQRALKEFIKQVPVDFPILMDHTGDLALAWKVFSFPSSFIIDKNGRVHYAINRAIDWNQAAIVEAINNLLDK